MSPVEVYLNGQKKGVLRGFSEVTLSEIGVSISWQEKDGNAWVREKDKDYCYQLRDKGCENRHLVDVPVDVDNLFGGQKAYIEYLISMIRTE